MASLDAHLYQQLAAPALWAAPHPLLPLTRLQTTLHLYSGHDVADWLYAQGTQLACARVAQWLSTLAAATRDGHEAVHAPLVRAFQERAFRHLWAFLEQEFSSHVLPLLATTQSNESVALAHAAASWLRILDVVAFPRLAASAAWWSWLQESVPCQADPESALMALDPASFLDHLSHGLAQHHPTLSPQTRWHVAHQARELAALLATLMEAGWERYHVHGLFAGSGRGMVCAVWVYVREGGHGHVSHCVRLTRAASGALTAEAVAFERSLTQALCATRQYLHRERRGDGQVDVHLVLEGAGQPELYEGPSLGLAVAVALIARATQRQVNSTVAVTGEVRADGSLAGVAGLPEKLQGVVAYNARLQAGLLQGQPITTVVIPADNVGAVEHRTWQARGITVQTAATLGQAVQAYELLDPWASVLQNSAGLHAALAPTLVQALARLDRVQRTVLVCPYTASPDEILQHVASTWASQRQQGNATRVPLLLKLLPFVQRESLVQQVLQQAQAAIPGQASGVLDTALILRQIQRGGFLWLLSGLDDLLSTDAAPDVLPHLLAQFSNAPLSRNAAVFACRQSTWEWARQMFAQAVPPFALLPLYEGRSTFLDWHQQSLMRQAAERLAACRVGWQQDREAPVRPRLPSPEEFFYGATPAFPAALYLDIRVRERLRDGTDAASPSLGQLIARSAQGQRILLLGAAGAGKSTELLKLFFDCCSGYSSAALRGLYAPLLLEAREISDHLGHNTYEAFLHGLYDALELPQTISMQHVEQALRSTPRLLIMLDGLDEVKPEGFQSRGQIAQILWRFSRALHPSSWVVCASRTQERGRAHESLLQALEAQRGVWRTFIIDDLVLDAGALRDYLQRVRPGETPGEVLMTTLQGRTSVLKTPLLVHLFGSMAPQKLAGHALNPGTIYRAAMETWLEEEIHIQGKPKLTGLQVPPGKTLVQVAMGLLGVLAHGMVEQGVHGLAASEVRDILAQFVTACMARHAALPGWWPLTNAGQRPLGVAATQVYGDELDVIVHALGELCVMQ